MLISVTKDEQEVIIIKTQGVFKTVEAVLSDSDITVTTLYRKKKKIPITHEKFRKATLIGAKIAELIFQASNVHFYRKIEQLKYVYNNWLKGHEVSIQVLGNYEISFI